MASTFESRRRGMCATLVGVLLAAFVSAPAGAVSQPSSPPRPSQVLAAMGRGAERVRALG